MGTVPAIRYVNWGNGKPRFHPTKDIAKLGIKGRVFRHKDGAWFTYEQTKAAMIPIYEQIARLQKADINQLRPTEQAEIAETISEIKERGQSLTVGMAVKAYLIACQHNIANAKSGEQAILRRSAPLSPKTLAGYKSQATCFERTCAVEWNAEASIITDSDVENIYTAFGKVHGLASTRQLRQVLSNAYQEHPRLKVRGNSIWWSATTLATLDPRVRAGSFAEIMHLIATADSMGRPDVGDMIMFGATTSQRQGDRIACLLSQRTEGFIAVKQSKTGALVHLTEQRLFTQRIEAQLKRRKAMKIDSVHLCISEATGKQWAHNNYAHCYDRVRAKAAETLPSVADLTDQDMRDTAVTWHVAAGSGLMQIASSTGHEPATIQQVIRHYMGHHPDISRETGDKLCAWLDGQEQKAKGTFLNQRKAQS